MTRELKPDICIIGAGSGGLSAAIAAAALGAFVVLIEKDRIGGQRLASATVPSMALAAAGRRARELRDATAFGIGDGEPDIDFRQVREHVRAVVDEIGRNDSEARLVALGVKIIHDAAYFADQRTVIAGDFAIRARRFVIATGTSPAVPTVPGLDGVNYLTEESLFHLARRPQHLVVLGASPSGLALAQAFRRLGSVVTVVDEGGILSNFDPEAAAVVRKALCAEGVDLCEDAKAVAVSARGTTAVRLEVETSEGRETIDGSHLLLSAGRVANVEGLRLGNARVGHGPGGIAVDRRLRTSNRRVYAIADVVPGLRSADRATLQAGLVVRSILFGTAADMRRQLLPVVAYTDPEIAHVGLDEASARRKKRRIRVLRWPYSQNDRAQAERRTRGLAKIITDPDGTILGATIAGAAASEQIAFWTLAVSRGLSAADLADTVVPGSTFGEIGKRAAITYFAPAARKRSTRMLLRVMRLFG